MISHTITTAAKTDGAGFALCRKREVTCLKLPQAKRVADTLAFLSMHTLSFTLTLEGVVRIHDAVLCLAKFSEVVSLEARQDKVGDAMYQSDSVRITA